jgi:hypothetical protein
MQKMNTLQSHPERTSVCDLVVYNDRLYFVGWDSTNLQTYEVLGNNMTRISSVADPGA